LSIIQDLKQRIYLEDSLMKMKYKEELGKREDASGVYDREMEYYFDNR
jgi:hypothetical protein